MLGAVVVTSVALAGPAPAAAVVGGPTGPGPVWAGAEAQARSRFGTDVGFTTHQVWHDEATALARYRQLADAGVGHVREAFDWGRIQPAPGTWDWTSPDRMMAAAARADVEVLGILAYSAPWASSDPSGGGDRFWPPRHDADFATYAAAVVERYGPGGTFWAERPDLVPSPVRAVEVWNEPWGPWFWKGGTDPAHYGRLAAATARAVHEAQPSVAVLASADLLDHHTPHVVLGWVDRLLAANPSLVDLIDGWSVHPYPEGSPATDRADRRWSFGRVEDVRRTLLAAGSDAPLWITEVGFSTAPDASGTVSERTQAEYVHAALVRALRGWPWVERAYLYSGERDGTDPDDREAWFGMFRADGSPKPAWAVVGALAAEGDHCAFVDVSALHPHHEPICRLAGGGVVLGYDDLHFRPAADISRVAAAVMLYRRAGHPAVPPGTPTFPDATGSGEAADAVAWAASSGLFSGYADGTFRPAASLSRAAAAAVLVRAAGLDVAPGPLPPDVDPSHPAAEHIATALRAGLMEPYADGRFDPGRPATRQAVAAWLDRLP